MTPDPSLESLILEACSAKPLRLHEISAALRQATNNPLLPDLKILDTLCNLLDTGKIVGATANGIRFYSVPQSAIGNHQPEVPHA